MAPHRKMIAPKTLLLHICCAPDATVPWPVLASDRRVVGYFYGGNIHPRGEYELRLAAVEELAVLGGRELIAPPYDTSEWDDAVRGLEGEPEGGARCAVCFRVQLKAAARTARSIGASELCTTLTISPHKDVRKINDIGRDAADSAGLEWVERVWRKGGGFARSVEISRELGLYRQDRCGCRCAMRESA